jgi:hypothetical protein
VTAPGSGDRERLRRICDEYFNGGPIRRLRRYRVGGRPRGARSLYEEAATLSARLAELAPPVPVHVVEVPRAEGPAFAPFASRYDNAREFDYVIHGSVADGTSTAASDVDDVVIVRREAFASFAAFRATRRILARLNLLYQRIDPLQHHGHWIFTEYDLGCYDAATMPVSIFGRGNAVAIGRPLRLELTPDPASPERSRAILVALAEELLTGVRDLYRGRANLYDLKVVVGAVSLLVPVALQCAGTDLNKRDAIARAHELLDAEPLRVLDWSTRVREEWDRLPTRRWLALARAVSYVLPDRRAVEAVARRLPPLRHEAAGAATLAPADFERFVESLERIAGAGRG